MIRSLRAAHRAAWIVIAVGLPGGIAAAIEARPALPEPVAEAEPTPEEIAVFGVWETGRWQGAEIDQRLSPRSLERHERIPWIARTVEVALAVREPLRVPDPLVYWSPTASTGPALPKDAQLVGAISEHGAGVYVPEPSGQLLIYSLGHGEVVARGDLP